MVSPLVSRPAFTAPNAALPETQTAASRTGIELRARRYEVLQIASRHGRASVARHFETAFGLDLPPPGQRFASGSRAVLCVSPGKWLAMAADPAAPRLDELGRALAGKAAMTCQSDALAFIEVSGPTIEAFMEKCAAIDLHPEKFPTGSATATLVALMRCYLSRLDDAPTFELAVARSTADSLLAHLTNAARSFGFSFTPSS